MFSGKMFMVWDGNHRLQAWLSIINDDHGQDQSWHFSMESIVLVVNRWLHRWLHLYTM
jgi:hypothetical protein